jgi:hypothetical protein
MSLMRWFWRIFSINTLILVVCCFFMALGIRQAIEIYTGFNNLVKHEGVVAVKFRYTEKPGKEDSVLVIKLFLTDTIRLLKPPQVSW